jgi:hypothetical protein
MSKGVRLREDLGAEDLRQVAGKVKDANQVRRLLALAAVYDGKDRAEAARIGAMDGRPCGIGRFASKKLR